MKAVADAGLLGDARGRGDSRGARAAACDGALQALHNLAFEPACHERVCRGALATLLAFAHGAADAVAAPRAPNDGADGAARPTTADAADAAADAARDESVTPAKLAARHLLNAFGGATSPLSPAKGPGAARLRLGARGTVVKP